MISPGTNDGELILRDRALPGLALVLDARGLLQQIKHLPMAATAEDFQLDYIRYKPGINCLGRYRYTSGGRQGWAYAKAFAAEARPKLQKAADLALEGDWANSTVVLPEWGVFVSFFPHDLKLRSIARLADPAASRRLFKRIFADQSEYADGQSEVLNYKPERRLVLRLAAPGTAPATLKFYTRREIDRLAAVERLLRRQPVVPTPRRIGQSHKHCCLAFEWIEGETLRARTSARPELINDHHEAGRLIARLHATSGRGLERLPQPGSPPALNSLAEQLGFLLPEIEGEAIRLARLLEGLERQPAHSPRLIHGDYYDKQVIASEGKFSLIDLDSGRIGDLHQDLACYLAHRERLALKLSSQISEEEQQRAVAFLDGYREEGGEFSQQLLRKWMAVHLLRLSHHPFRDRDPDWTVQTKRILARATRLLADDVAHLKVARA